MTTEPKFCKDCVHFNDAGSIPYLGVSWSASCNQPPELDLIHGRKTPARPLVMRGEDGACKPQALLWQKRPAPPVASLQPPVPTQAQADIENAAIPRSTCSAAWWGFWK